MDRPLEPRPIDSDSDSESDSDDEGTYVVREGAVRSIDSEVTTARDQLVTDADASRAESLAGGVAPDPTLGGPPDMRESVDVAAVAPDGTAVGGGGLTDPTGASIGGSSLSGDIQSRAGALGGDALGRGIDFDPASPGTNDSSGGSSGGDADLDRMLMGHDGSLYSAERTLPVYDEKPAGGTPAKDDSNALKDIYNSVKDFFGGETGGGTDGGTGGGGARTPNPTKKEIPGYTPDPYGMENPDGDTGGSSGVTVGGADANLERVRVMGGSAVNPSTNPNDGGEGSTDNFIPPADLETMPAQEGAVEGTTLTAATRLGSSPVVNPTDPALGDDGIIQGGSYGGGGSSGGGGETTPMGMAGDALADKEDFNGATVDMATGQMVGGEAGGGGTGDLDQKSDVNGASIDMVTGQVIGSSAPASGGEMAGAGGTVSQGEDGDDDGGGTQTFGTASAFATAAPISAGLAAGGLVSQGDEGDDEDASRALGGDASLASDASLGLGAPGGPGALEGPPAIGEEGPPLPGEEG